MQHLMAETDTRTAQRGNVRIHPEGGTVITARMPSAEECTRGYAPGMPVLAVTWPDGESREYPADMVALVIGDREATADEARDAARSVLGNITEDLDNLMAKIGQLNDAIGRSPGTVVSLAAELKDEREREYFCLDTGDCLKNSYGRSHDH